MTFTVHTPSQIAFAEFVPRDPPPSALAPFYQQKRDLFLQLIERLAVPAAARARAPTSSCSTTRRSRATRDREMAMRLITEHGVASIPCSAFLYKDGGGPVLRFCFAKKDETLRARGGAAPARLTQCTARRPLTRISAQVPREAALCDPTASDTRATPLRSCTPSSVRVELRRWRWP